CSAVDGAAIAERDLEETIKQEYNTFLSNNHNAANQNVCAAVQFIEYLQNEPDIKHLAEKIALIISKGAGVGGISNRAATPAERALMVKGINYSVRKGTAKNYFSLEFIGLENYVEKHRKFVQQLRDGAIQINRTNLSPLNVPKNPMYRGTFPVAPVVHTYHPLAVSDYYRALKLDTKTVRPLLSTNPDVPDDSIDVYWVPQIRDTGSLDAEAGAGGLDLMRYHYWVSPDGQPWDGQVWSKGIAAPLGETLNQDWGATGQVSVHLDDAEVMVSSPDNYSINGLLPNAETNVAFWSLVQNPNTGRYALTLHWLLNGTDHNALSEMLNRARNFSALGDWINGYPSLKKLYHFAF
ncbi:MAG: hypothetical protein NTX76_02900, partial [Alphaproteobacteria bacterium]|nr:hypothetical protein [Alphaproteobacteria bacterium]